MLIATQVIDNRGPKVIDGTYVTTGEKNGPRNQPSNQNRFPRFSRA